MATDKEVQKLLKLAYGEPQILIDALKFKEDHDSQEKSQERVKWKRAFRELPDVKKELADLKIRLTTIEIVARQYPDLALDLCKDCSLKPFDAEKCSKCPVGKYASWKDRLLAEFSKEEQN